MMKYPKLNEIPTTRDILDKFKGYNHNLRIGEGEFYDMQNLTGDDYPILSPRKKRGTYGTATNPNGMCSNTSFCYVDGQDFHLVGKDERGETVDETVNLMLTNSPKELISIGSNVVVMPDQKYINTVNISERGNLLKGVYDLPYQLSGSEKKPKLVCAFIFESSGETIVNKAKNIGIVIGAAQKGYSAAEYQGWYSFEYTYHSTSGKPFTWELYVSIKSATTGTWQWARTSVPIIIAIFGIDDDEEYFAAKVQEITSQAPTNRLGYAKINGLGNSVDGQSLYLAEQEVHDSATTNETVTRTALGISLGSSLVSTIEPWLMGATFGGVVPLYTLDTPITVTTSDVSDSTIPSMDYIMESGNRLWGCRYGLANNGDFVNEIYASRLADFKDWVMPEVTTSQSPYRASVGTSGAFTGAINYGGKPIFFKEDCMHRVFGDYTPYTVQMIPCKGVQEGCSKSLAIVNDVLYYKSRSGICAYDGSLPVEISYDFGDKQYKNAVGGAIGNKYYVSMEDEEGDWSTFVYDTVKKMWHREDDLQASQFCNHQGNLYYIDHSDRRIHVVKGTGEGVVPEESVKWSAETGILGATTPDNKYVTRIDLRMSVAKGSRVAVHIEYDSMGDWERLMEIDGLTLTTFTIPVIPRRCDHFRLKFEGEGDAKIFSISKTLEEAE